MASRRPGEVKAAVGALKAGTGVNYEGVSGNIDLDDSEPVAPCEIWKAVDSVNP